MKLLEFEVLGQSLSLQMHDGGLQCLYIDEVRVSEVDLAKVYGSEIAHRTTLQEEDKITQLSLNLQASGGKAQYQLWLDNRQVQTGEILLQNTPTTAKPKESFMGFLALAFKLFKSVKVVKVVLAGASVAGYAWLFSIEFALVLIASLVVHEYGHIRAMKYFGMKTKGIYLIPFVGGLAMSDDKINTRWQDVVISIMGPCFGLFMAVACLLIYFITQIELFAGAAVLGALLNLFNLLPILPLDGGHVLKSISFSMRSWIGLSVCIAGIALGLIVAYTFGLVLLVFFLFIGALEVVFQWRQRNLSHLRPLDRNGQMFSAIWYVLVVAGHLGIIASFAGSESPILTLPLKILSS